MAVSIQNNDQFIRSEIFAINWHIASRRLIGDERPENDIVIEWIVKNVSSFSNNFTMAQR